MPLTAQVRLVLVSLVTVAMNGCVPIPACTFAPAGDSDTEPTVVIVTLALPDLVGSATDTALTFTDAGEGSFAGAV